MDTRYLLRFDDACPAMGWKMWDQIEKVLIQFGIRPLIAVVPDNEDEKLNIEPPNPQFWDRVRDWQARGYSIGLHGYQHRLVSESGGLMGIHTRSEFAGLSESVQAAKLDSALRCFERERVVPDLWIAPAHSFDNITLRLLRERGIRIVSDGFGLRPFVDSANTLWIPQQIWRLRPVPPGVWTVCMHSNEWSSQELLEFRAAVTRYADQIGNLEEIAHLYGERHEGVSDVIVRALLYSSLKVKRTIRNRRRTRLLRVVAATK